MCGIVGIVGRDPVAPRLVEGLRRLEYRGYDSAGLATLVGGAIERRRAEGKLQALADLLVEQPLPGVTGIGHTRWATHGAPTTTNAHPHATAQVAVVHNGIIENFRELKDELVARGHEFESETDSEVVAHLISDGIDRGLGPQAAVAAALRRLRGAFALAMLFAGEDGLLIGARRGSPLAVGFGEGEMYLGSDALALSSWTRRVLYLEEGDWVVLNHDGAEVFDAEDRPVQRAVRTVALSPAMIEKGNYRHYMQKEIFEQPQVIGDALATYLDPATRRPRLPAAGPDWNAVGRLTIVACGTSSYAALVAKYWFEQVARLPVEVDIASEFRYREAPLPKGGAALFISQSGETADTLAALRYAKAEGQFIVALVNVPESSMAREADLVLPILAGPEIGVASTKAFTCQLTVLMCLVLSVARERGTLDAAEEARLCAALSEVPARALEVLNHDEKIREIALRLAEARDVLYLGRGAIFPVALEGALKLKEISYIHAEGYAAGELKHGPIALIDDQVPVIVLAPHGPLFEKTVSNMQEVLARGGRVILLSDMDGVATEGRHAAEIIELPKVDPFVTPVLYAIPVQLLAYHTAVAKGTDVDQPRNLAKSVTVE
ncbi:glutamine--fructose-6-phosphate transaminase (isomerizing) [Zavarzinia compransoris]|uniref:Glutamine--fructose-6-phosphate aminotransferase [isomerizing] n=1 Tax=Zavarzinia compransoris TaxID=1264899 RepID=A0A317E7Q6_9PROT|nr:glutamine--fructose-6-phosphate transaminase (isomerizing) [Zavarzinia compransoris]PWR23097.1 glutamine--fructose-6-phosphate transaminase (isomerizing) [Zavarzinia compransoris]TDP46353.1 glutamine--fructose-6-phosphate transaminase [Zavarzinia compransoris]